MSILVGPDTKVVVQGITGREGSFHARRMVDAGTAVVAGVTPGRGGTRVDGIPVFDTVAEAVEMTGANASVIFVPAPYAFDAVMEAAGFVPLIVTITEGIPVADMVRARVALRSRVLNGREVTLIGPNCPGIVSPRFANIGIMPASIFSEGRVGVVSRSGTLTYEIVNDLSKAGLGQSTCVGIGGDPVGGSSFVDILTLFEGDPHTDAVVLVGEIGGDDEELAAGYVARMMTKPVVAYIAGFSAPPGKRMGHAGAIISQGKGTAAAKKQALERAGVPVATTPAAVVGLTSEALSGSG